MSMNTVFISILALIKNVLSYLSLSLLSLHRLYSGWANTAMTPQASAMLPKLWWIANHPSG